jgi:CubicO group peptidase (beta-lactamase class C family)
MIGKTFRLALLLFMNVSSTCLCAQPSDSSPLLPEVARAMEKFVSDGEVAGVVTLVAEEQRILHFHATGWADLEGKKPLAKDSIFWIASMTNW